MLVLTRRPGQHISIGGNIDVKVVSVSSDSGVRIGVTAPKHLEICRPEKHTVSGVRSLALVDLEPDKFYWLTGLKLAPDAVFQCIADDSTPAVLRSVRREYNAKQLNGFLLNGAQLFEVSRP